MSSFLKALGLSSSGNSSSSSSKGHILGGNDTSSSGSNPSNTNSTADCYDITFTEETLGIKVNPVSANNNNIVVTEVIARSSASNAGICAGDVVLSVDGNAVNDVKAFVEIIQAIGRPVTIRFKKGSNTRIQQNTSSSFSSSVYKSMTGNSQTKTVASLPPMTEEEKEQMRLDRLKAAEDRGKAWDKRVAQGRNHTKSKQDDLKQPTSEQSNDVNPETDRTIQIVKAAEARQAAQLGYNPYKPVMSFKADDPNQNAKPSTDVASSKSSGNTSPRPENTLEDMIQSININEIDADVVVAIDSAIALLLSNETTSQAAMTTIQKILTNIISNKTEPKYRTIRLQNPAIKSKVIDVVGGLDLLLATGFQLNNDVATEATLEYMVTDDYESKIGYCLKCINNLLG